MYLLTNPWSHNIPAQKWHCFPIVLCVLHPTLPYLHTPNNIDNCLTHSSINVNIKWRKNYTQKYHDLRWVIDPEMGDISRDGWQIQRWVTDPEMGDRSKVIYVQYNNIVLLSYIHKLPFIRNNACNSANKLKIIAAADW